ncbi:hypothetical protein DM02DRAFT_653294 [Periconia macrospinosa]|uniref:Uncharacterized protein n=1 Tax=Periconia macrospinosa TaxID=97972 RepID=A0A2V1E0E1_9PLEO|nr:hypothetical protein DM02DRAFT_653294 [Periconia macrospinosa]
MTSKRTLFVPFDPSKAQRTSSDRRPRSDNRLLCQICFKPFGTIQALRDHIGDFQARQLEIQQLTARMLEAQAHLPSLENQHHAICNDDGGGTDNDEDDDGGDDAGSGDHPRLQCPYPACDREKLFNRRQGLLRHFQSHVQCYETCVFCRTSFNRVRLFLIHQCKAKTRVDDKAKEYYMKERCAQLRRYATESLHQMLAREDTSHERTRKRGHEVMNECSERPSPQMTTVDADRWFPVDNSPGNEPASNMPQVSNPNTDAVAFKWAWNSS